MSYYGPTTTREIGAGRPPSLGWVLAAIVTRVIRRTFVNTWTKVSSPNVVRQKGRTRNVRVRTSLGNGEEKRSVVLHSRIGYALRVGFGLGTGVALLGVLLTKLFGREHS